MLKKSKANSSELLNSHDNPKHYKTIRFLIACQLSVSAGALFIKQLDSAEAQSQVPETSKSDETAHMLQTEELQNDSVHKRQIIKRLGRYGLEPVEDPEGINSQEQFMVTADSKCAVQFGVSSERFGTITVSTYLIGPVGALTNRKLSNLDGTARGQTIHAEGEPEIGVEFTSDPKHVGNVVAYIRDNTDFYCDLLANHQ